MGFRFKRVKKLIAGVIVLCLPAIVLAGEIEVYFSPRGNCASEITQELTTARKSVVVAMYSFTSQELAEALVSAQKRGVTVRVYLDEGQETQHHVKAQYLSSNGVAVRFEHGNGLMHNKFCVIDGKTMITGSYNWTQSAERSNDENVIILHDPIVADMYDRQFEKFWQIGSQ